MQDFMEISDLFRIKCKIFVDSNANKPKDVNM